MKNVKHEDGGRGLRWVGEILRLVEMSHSVAFCCIGVGARQGAGGFVGFVCRIGGGNRGFLSGGGGYWVCSVIRDGG
jgi:hypothetical protein